MNILFLDDERTIKDVFWIFYPKYTSVTVVRNLQEFKAAVRMIGSFKDYLFSFDHDLQDFTDDHQENTGYTCVHWLIDYMVEHEIEPESNLDYVVHSQNVIGKTNIESYIENAKRHLKF